MLTHACISYSSHLQSRKERKKVTLFNLNSESVNSETCATAHMLNAIMIFDFLYVVGYETVLIDTDIYL